jgi:HSP20 family molecular chaperone IbpA
MAMAEKESLELQEQQTIDEETERTRECRCFIPKTDIYEYEEAIYLVLDMPGIHENAIEINLEKNILEVNGYSQVEELEGQVLVRAEYEPGDFERKFRISDSIDREKINATLKNGVLRIKLPKVETAKTRKITVKSQ